MICVVCQKREGISCGICYGQALELARKQSAKNELERVLEVICLREMKNIGGGISNIAFKRYLLERLEELK